MTRHRPNDTRYPFAALAAGIIIGAGVAGALFLLGAPPALVALAGAATVVFVASSLKYVDQWERAVVMRLGSYRGLRGPGYFAIIPSSETDTRSRCLRHRSAHSNDGVRGGIMPHA